MSAFLLTFQIATMILPLVMQAVQTFEVPGASGQDKFNAVVGVVTIAIENLPDKIKAKIEKNKIGNIVQQVIPLVVTLLNASGVFKTTKKT